jgi:hypothetical protein
VLGASGANEHCCSICCELITVTEVLRAGVTTPVGLYTTASPAAVGADTSTGCGAVPVREWRRRSGRTALRRCRPRSGAARRCRQSDLISRLQVWRRRLLRGGREYDERQQQRGEALVQATRQRTPRWGGFAENDMVMDLGA